MCKTKKKSSNKEITLFKKILRTKRFSFLDGFRGVGVVIPIRLSKKLHIVLPRVRCDSIENRDEFKSFLTFILLLFAYTFLHEVITYININLPSI